MNERVALRQTDTNVANRTTDAGRASDGLKRKQAVQPVRMAKTLRVSGDELRGAKTLRVAGDELRAAKNPRMVGDEFRAWQKQWRAIMRTSTVYFDAVTDTARRDKAARALAVWGATVSPFFHKDVSIIVTTREFDIRRVYPLNDVFLIATKEKMKVWTHEKLFRFLNNLDETPGSVAPTASEARLAALLYKEKIQGPSDRDMAARRDDFHYFKGTYFFIHDLKQRYRPIATREWRAETKDTIPKLYASSDGRCPFVADAVCLDPQRKRERRLRKFRESRRYRQKLAHFSRLTPSHSPLRMIHVVRPLGLPPVMGPLVPPLNPYDNGTGTIEGIDGVGELRVTESNERDGAQESYATGKEGAEETEGTPETDRTDGAEDRAAKPFTAPPLVHASSILQAVAPKRPFFEIEASGVNTFSTNNTLQSGKEGFGNGLAPLVAEVRSKSLNSLQKNIAFSLKPPPVRATAAAAASPSPEPRVSKPGYCENCRIKYDHFDDHIESKKHRAFAVTDSNFSDIDRLMMELRSAQRHGY